MKKFAVFDIDGTLIRWQLYHAVANALLQQGSDRALYQQVREARMQWKVRTHHDSFREYEETVVAAYETVLKHISVAQFQSAADAVFDEYKEQVYTYTRDLIRDLKKKGYLLLAVSGSQEELVRKIADYYGFDDCVGTTYEKKAGTFTGEKVVGSANKKKVLLELINKHDLSFNDSVGVGDSESDIPMLEVVQKPIAFNPTRGLFEHARSEHWQVVVERKNMSYKLEAKNGSYVLAETN